MNKTLKALGYSKKDRVAIIHTDDIGMCYASVAAYQELHEYGLISAGSVMVPCPWMPMIAAFNNSHPEVDLGVHITLTSEWDLYRWKPISTFDFASGLLDVDGYFHKTSEAVAQYADPVYVEKEINAQIDRAIAMGIQPTHIDTHMFSVATDKLLSIYIRIGLERGVPPMLIRLTHKELQEFGLSEAAATTILEHFDEYEDQCIPIMDQIMMMSLEEPENRIGQAKALFAAIKPGITYFITHPSVDTPELRALAPDWRCRVEDYKILKSDELRQFIHEQGIQVIGYRALQEAFIESQN
jgi:predicted glycoside hydrolase/deacetylase ChbG (UPF0249 family)